MTDLFLLVEDLHNLFKPIKVKMLMGRPSQPICPRSYLKNIRFAHKSLCNGYSVSLILKTAPILFLSRQQILEEKGRNLTIR